MDITIIKELDSLLLKYKKLEGKIYLSGISLKQYKSLEKYGLIDKKIKRMYSYQKTNFF